MTIRLDKALVASTEQLLGAVLTEFNNDNRVMVLCDSGKGRDVAQRLRVKLSRVRKERKARGAKIRYFKFSCTVHQHTEDGLRYDCLVMWKTQEETHKAIEQLEDFLGHSHAIL